MVFLFSYSSLCLWAARRPDTPQTAHERGRAKNPMRAKRSILITIFLPDSRERPAAYTLLSHAPSGAHAGVVQRQNVGFPSRTRGFDSRYPLQPQTGAYLQFYNAGAPSDPGTWQDGVAVAQRPHKPYGGGSNPPPATIWRREKSNTEGREGTPTCVPDWNALPPMPGKPARIQPGVCRAKTAHTSKEVYPPKARARAEGEKSPA